jgi:hypothetical protein
MGGTALEDYNIQDVATSRVPGRRVYSHPIPAVFAGVVTRPSYNTECNAPPTRLRDAPVANHHYSSYLKKHRPQRPGVLQDHWPSDDESVIKDP